MHILASIIVAAVSLMSSASFSTEFYVRSNSECIHNGDGTSSDCASINGGVGAWNEFSSILWGQAGDTLYICGNLSGMLDVGSDGTETENFIISGACPGNPGKIDGGNDIAALLVGNRQYVLITELELVGGTRSTLRISPNPKNTPLFIQVNRSRIHDPIFSNVDGFGKCVRVSGSDITIEHSEIYNCSDDGIYIASDRVEVGYSYVHDTDTSDNYRGDSVKYGSESACNDGYVHHNVLDHSSNNRQKNNLIIAGTGSGTVAEYNTLIGGRIALSIRNHHAPIIRYNRIIPPAPEAALFWSTGILLENSFDAKVYRNLVDASAAPTFALFSTSGSANSKIDNNVFYGNPLVATIKLHQGTSAYLRNNIVGGINSSLTLGVNALLVESDNNRFISDLPNLISFSGDSYDSFSDYQAQNPSLDQHSTTGNPFFINGPGGNFRLISTSPLIDAGTTLNVPQDKRRLLISTNTPPDIGAYEMNENLVGSPLLPEVYEALTY